MRTTLSLIAAVVAVWATGCANILDKCKPHDDGTCSCYAATLTYRVAEGAVIHREAAYALGLNHKTCEVEPIRLDGAGIEYGITPKTQNGAQ